MVKFRSVFVAFAVCVAFLATPASASSRNRFSLSSLTEGDANNNRKRSNTGSDAWVESFSLPRRPSAPPTSANGSTTPKHFHKKEHHHHHHRGMISKQTFASGMALLTGIADVLCFRMNRCYANMMTGNSIKMASALGELRWNDMLLFASLVLCYATGSTLYRTLVHYHHDQPKPHVTARATASPLILLAFAMSDILFHTNKSSLLLVEGTTTTFFCMSHVLLLALGFGLLNTASTDATGGTISFAMTGHISKISQGLSDWLLAPPRKRRWRSANRLSAHIFGFFLLGVLCGTLLATAGSQHVIMPASGMSVASFFVEHNNSLPIFSILGIVAVLLLQLHDQPLPKMFVTGWWSSLLDFRQQRKSNGDVSVNKSWSPASYQWW